MPSVSKKQAHLFLAVAKNPAFARKTGIPQSVGREFHAADKRTGILKKGGGGPASMMGHALSGTQLGGADNLIRKAQDRFTMFADGGAVKKPAGPSAKERREIRDMIVQGKSDAVGALRQMRGALIDTQEDTPVRDPATSLARLSSKLSMKGNAPASNTASPKELYEQYHQIMDSVENESDPAQQIAMMDRLTSISSQLGKLGIPLPPPR